MSTLGAMRQTGEDDPCYIGRCQCGVMVAAVVIDPLFPDDPAHCQVHRRRVARTVAEFVRDGLQVERVTTADVRRQFDFCTCPAVAPKSRRQAELWGARQP